MKYQYWQVSLSFHEKQWCHESAAASEQKKGSKFSCSSSVVSKQASKANKYCALCVCVFGLCSLLYNSIYKFHTLVYTLFKLFMHSFYSLLMPLKKGGQTNFPHSSSLLGWSLLGTTKRKVNKCLCASSASSDFTNHSEQKDLVRMQWIHWSSE